MSYFIIYWEKITGMINYWYDYTPNCTPLDSIVLAKVIRCTPVRSNSLVIVIGDC